MPFGQKSDAQSRIVDFDHIYRSVLVPAIADAGMEPLRADEERDGGIIHKPMFERLLLCPFAIADLTLANANVFYELGVRHAVRPYATVLLFEKAGQRLPFDVAPLRALPYEVDAAGQIVDPADLRRTITDRLNAARDPAPDSPLYQLLDGISPPDIARLKTDVFRDRVRYNQRMKDRLAEARQADVDAVRAIQRELAPVADQEAGVVIDLFLSYRHFSAWQTMIDLTEEMSPPIRASVLVQEQLALALNRAGRDSDAERTLERLIDTYGPSSETYGLLGRVHKDRWERAIEAGRSLEAAAHLRRAIDSYRRGFESDWRDAFPGVNAVTLLEIESPGQTQMHELMPVVRYAVQRRLIGAKPDYWDHASLMELSVIANDDNTARRELGECLAMAEATWMLETTARNLRLIGSARQARDADPALALELAKSLTERAKKE
jgi:tetratricopeptide (TPR) repeat protein